MSTDNADTNSALCSANSAGSAVAFVESKIVDYQPLVSATGDNIDGVVLDSNGDDIERIANWLEGQHETEAVRIISDATAASAPC